MVNPKWRHQRDCLFYEIVYLIEEVSSPLRGDQRYNKRKRKRNISGGFHDYDRQADRHSDNTPQLRRRSDQRVFSRMHQCLSPETKARGIQNK